MFTSSGSVLWWSDEELSSWLCSDVLIIGAEKKEADNDNDKIETNFLSLALPRHQKSIACQITSNSTVCLGWQQRKHHVPLWGESKSQKASIAEIVSMSWQLDQTRWGLNKWPHFANGVFECIFLNLKRKYLHFFQLSISQDWYR